ncbi:unnamed protein product [Rotaria sordida]|uniref:Uncharacterized protein n=1 Tax=Rotaria sordida TaxID=392033 RepID=A0A814PV40_9BILA|nr:unnamed protein product [Rotaria sordida]CAF1368579.1 unnamed protein product [Rotaria sordida]
MDPHKGQQTAKQEQVSLGAQLAEGELNFGVAHIYAKTIARVTGGIKVQVDRDQASPYAAMLAVQDVAERCRGLRITALHVRLRATEPTLDCHIVDEGELEVHFG